MVAAPPRPEGTPVLGVNWNPYELPWWYFVGWAVLVAVFFGWACIHDYRKRQRALDRQAAETARFEAKKERDGD